jgi:hypothetical protein
MATSFDPSGIDAWIDASNPDDQVDELPEDDWDY